MVTVGAKENHVRLKPKKGLRPQVSLPGGELTAIPPVPLADKPSVATPYPQSMVPVFLEKCAGERGEKGWGVPRIEERASLCGTPRRLA